MSDWTYAEFTYNPPLSDVDRLLADTALIVGPAPLRGSKPLIRNRVVFDHLVNEILEEMEASAHE